MNRILRLRIIQKYDSQADFAKLLGIDESVVSRVIRERRELSPEECQRWADALGCKPEDVFETERRL